MQPPSSMHIPCWCSPLPQYPHGHASDHMATWALVWPRGYQDGGERQQGICMWGKGRRQECAPERTVWPTGDHRTSWAQSWWCVIPHVFLEVTKAKEPCPSHLYLLPYHGFGGGVKTPWRVAKMIFQSLCIRWMGGSGLSPGCMCVLRLPIASEYQCLDTKGNVELNLAFSLAQYWSLNRKRPNRKLYIHGNMELSSYDSTSTTVIILLSFLQLHSLMVLKDPQLLQLIIICHLWLNNAAKRISLTEILCSHFKNNIYHILLS